VVVVVGRGDGGFGVVVDLAWFRFISFPILLGVINRQEPPSPGYAPVIVVVVVVVVVVGRGGGSFGVVADLALFQPDTKTRQPSDDSGLEL